MEAESHMDELDITWRRTDLADPGKLKPKPAMQKLRIKPIYIAEYQKGILNRQHQALQQMGVNLDSK